VFFNSLLIIALVSLESAKHMLEADLRLLRSKNLNTLSHETDKSVAVVSRRVS